MAIQQRGKGRARPIPIHSAAKKYGTYQRWKRGFKHIQDAIIEMAHHRRIYREVTAMIDANPNLQVPSAFYDWMRLVYVNDMTVAIRRLVDWHPRTISFIRLMREIEDHPEVITRRRFVHGYKGRLRGAGHKDFERFARPGAQHIDPRVIRGHRRELVAAQRRLREFVNRYVAHRSRYPMRRLPTYDELDACVDLLERLVREYVLLLEQSGLAEVVPVIQYDWKRPFRVPWIVEGERPRR